MSLASLLSSKGASGFGYASTAEHVTAGLDLTGRHVLITGSNSGLGLETARVLTMRGATVIGTARTEEKAREALGPLGGSTIPVALELGEPDSVRACVRSVRSLGVPIDAIIANAGIMALPQHEKLHGIERQLFTNHVGHFLLVTGIVASLADRGRVVMLSSGAHNNAPDCGIELDNLSGDRNYRQWKAYGQSKLANLLFARSLAARFAGSTRMANAVHPGVIATNLGRHMSAVQRFGLLAAAPLFMKSPEEGAATQTWAAVHPDTAAISGEYLSDCNVKASSALGRDLALAARLWEATEAIVERVGGPA